MTVTRTLLAVSLTLLCLEGAAHAQASEAQEEAARELARQGIEAFDQHDYQIALQKLQEAYELAHVDQIRFNIALCLERLARFREAALQYDAAATSAQLSETQRDRARAAAVKVRGRLGTVRVTGSAGDVEARIDDGQVCTLPCTVSVDPGAHVVVVGEGVTQRSVRFVARRAQETSVALPRITLVPSPETQRRGYRPGWLTWTGAAVTTVGLASTVGFGLRTNSLHNQFNAMPSVALADEGERMRDFTNLSIGVAVVGGVLVILDLATGGR